MKQQEYAAMLFEKLKEAVDEYQALRAQLAEMTSRLRFQYRHLALCAEFVRLEGGTCELPPDPFKGGRKLRAGIAPSAAPSQEP